MKFALLLSAIALPLALHAEQSDCSGKYSCGDEVVTGVDTRQAPQVIQPNSEAIMGLCKVEIPSSQSYKAVIHSLKCGEGAESKDRFPAPVSKDIMDEWDLLSRSGIANAQEKMQKLRQTDLSWTGVVDFPMYESWSFEKKVGGFDGRCGMEPWETTCERTRTEVYTTEETYCAEYEQIIDAPTPSVTPSVAPRSNYNPSSSGGSSGGYKPTPTPSPYKSTVPPAPKGRGESGGSLRNSYQDRVNSYKKRSSYEVLPKRFIASAGKCIRYGTRTLKHTRPADSLKYRCMKSRPKFCEWFETQTVTRRCPDHKANYTVEYKKDPSWQPGYVDKSNPARSYIDILPNKYDLLNGESEEVAVFSNTGVSTQLQPKAKITSKWNEYRSEAVPYAIQCEFGMTPTFKIEIATVGRNKQRAPNPLGLRADEKGNPIEPLAFETAVNGKGKPYQIRLQDKSRATLLAAAQNSRTFARPDDAAEADTNAIYKKAKNKDIPGMSASGGYWAETQFKMQLFRTDKWGRLVRVTLPNKFSSNQGDIVGDTINISLKGKDGLEKFYRPGGPLEFIFGGIYKRFGVELTPGYEYVIKVQTTQRGLPFYESGCRDGGSVCEGEEASTDSYSEPLLIKWTADENVDERGWLKKFRDFQEHFLVF